MDTRADSFAHGGLRDLPMVDSGCGDAGESPDAMRSLFSAIVDQIALGIVVATIDRTVLHANRAALAGLRSSGLRITANRRLESSRPNDNAALEEALSAVAGQQCTLIALGDERHRLNMAVQPLATPQARTGPRAMLLFNKPVLCDAPALLAYSRAHQLTPAENAVVEGLCSGLRAKEVALRTRASIATVRSHLRNIYCKTGARNLQDLLARVASLPPISAPNT